MGYDFSFYAFDHETPGSTAYYVSTARGPERAILSPCPHGVERPGPGDPHCATCSASGTCGWQFPFTLWAYDHVVTTTTTTSTTRTNSTTSTTTITTTRNSSTLCEPNAVVGTCFLTGCWVWRHGWSHCHRGHCVCDAGYCSSNGKYCVHASNQTLGKMPDFQQLEKEEQSFVELDQAIAPTFHRVESQVVMIGSVLLVLMVVLVLVMRPRGNLVVDGVVGVDGRARLLDNRAP